VTVAGSFCVAGASVNLYSGSVLLRSWHQLSAVLHDFGMLLMAWVRVL
jgi:hypothetical protein